MFVRDKERQSFGKGNRIPQFSRKYVSSEERRALSDEASSKEWVDGTSPFWLRTRI